MRAAENEYVTDLYCDGIKDPIPWKGTPDEFEEERRRARSNAGRYGSEAMILRWRMPSGESIMLDLNKTHVKAMVERRVSP